ncbi:hypothetical protein JB92DRAFT_3123101 [Gautieria morchelliformis]|nr:hypothetical protein JB92DRAFT_3123101 [Gautieria morchelliformis]
MSHYGSRRIFPLKRPKPQAPKVTYRCDAWENAVLDFAGDKLTVTRHQRQLRLEQRGFIFDQTDAVIHDPLSDVLGAARTPSRPLSNPLTSHSLHSAAYKVVMLGLVEPAGIERAMPPFLSPFAKDALWNTDTVRMDLRGADLTAGSMSPESGPFFELPPLRSGDKYLLRPAWTAWAPPSNFKANPLVARGGLTDRLTIIDGRPLIAHRLFFIENLLQPKFIRPKSLHKEPHTVLHTPNSDTDACGLVVLTASQHTLRTLRSGQNSMGAVVALRALLSSTQPLLDARSHGIASALVSVVPLGIGWVLSPAEA